MRYSAWKTGRLLMSAIMLTLAGMANAQTNTVSDEMLTDADELMTAAMSKLFDQNGSRSSTTDAQRYQWSDKYVRGESKGNGNTTIWPQGFGLATLSQMAQAARNTDHYTTYLNAARRLANKFPNYITTINGIKGYSVHGGTQHRFLDDNAWAALGLLDVYDLTKTSSYLTAAKMVATYMVEAGRLLESNPPGGGGMYWQDSPADDTNTYKTKNTANNGPAVVIFCRLYELTGDETYLNYARITYQWLYNVLLDKASWLMWDNINVVTGEINKYQAPYTTGTMLHAASILYRITGEATYKQHADKLAQSAYLRWFETYESKELGQSIKLVKSEGNTHSDDIVVLLRGYEEYAASSENSRYLTAFAQSLRQIWATRRDAETGLMNYDWKGTATQNEWTTLGQTGYVEMYARLALAAAKGWVAEGNAAVPMVIEAENATKNGGVTTSNDTHCSGGKYVGYVGNGNSLTFTYKAEQEGIYELTVYYMTIGQRNLEVKVNGKDSYTFGCPSSGSWDGTNIGNTSIDIALKKGTNTIVVGNSSGNAPNLDKFLLLYAGPIEKDETEEIDMTNAISATSPDGKMEVKIVTDTKGRAYYAVLTDGKVIVEPSVLGFAGISTFEGGILEHSTEDIHDPYEQLHGKVSHSDNNYTLFKATLGNDSSAPLMTVDFRIYDKGVAFRYDIASGGATTVTSEPTEFNIADFKQMTALEYRHQYSWYYGQYNWENLTSDRGYCEPVLVQRSDDLCVLLTEAANYGETGANAIVCGDRKGQLRLVGANKTNNYASSTIKYPFISAWRTLIIGTMADIVESNLVNDLNPPSYITDLSWIRPGRVAWNWAGEDRMRTNDINVAKRYADLAAYLGWEYVLIDEGWEGNFRLEDFVPYAEERGVGVIVWYHNNKFQNSYTSCLTKFRQQANIGVKAVKIDFFDDDAQTVIKKYENLLRAAADAKLMVDFHGCTRPTGWERKYPNLMTMEAVLGGEFLLDQPHMNQADHSTNVAITRNVIGAMDFTPTKLAQCTGSLKTHNNTTENPNTTWSYQLALWTLFESGFQCLIDCPENIIDSPIEPALRTIPVTWDETRCLEAEPAKYITMARRNGEDWYVASISKTARTLRLPLNFLPEGKTYFAYIYRDGTASQFDINFQKREVTSGTTLSLSVKGNGGATVILSTKPDLPAMQTVSYEAESAIGATTAQNTQCSKGSYKSGIANTKNLNFRSVKVDSAGDYALTLYYMLPEESRSAYVQVETEGEKLYYDFHARDDYDRTKGLILGIKTVYVHLEAGTNRIYYGNDNGSAPDLDKITVTPSWTLQQEIADGMASPLTPENALSLTIVGSEAVTHSTVPGRLSFYTLDGSLLHAVDIPAGNARTSLGQQTGTVIVSLSAGSHATARKVVLP